MWEILTISYTGLTRETKYPLHYHQGFCCRGRTENWGKSGENPALCRNGKDFYLSPNAHLEERHAVANEHWWKHAEHCGSAIIQLLSNDSHYATGQG